MNEERRPVTLPDPEDDPQDDPTVEPRGTISMNDIHINTTDITINPSVTLNVDGELTRYQHDSSIECNLSTYHGNIEGYHSTPSVIDSDGIIRDITTERVINPPIPDIINISGITTDHVTIPPGRGINVNYANAHDELRFYQNGIDSLQHINPSPYTIIKLNYDQRELVRNNNIRILYDLIKKGDKRSRRLMINKLDVNKGWIQLEDYKTTDIEVGGEGTAFIIVAVNLIDDHGYNVGDIILCNSVDVKTTKLTDNKTKGGNLFISIKSDNIVGKLRL